MRTVANVFLTTRQMGEAEAIYRLNPSLLLKNSNIACQWVSLGQKKDRSSRWVKATEDQLLAGVKAVELEGHEGLFVEQQDLWSKYLRRPDCLEEISFAQFAKMYRSYSSKKKGEDEDDLYESDDDLQNHECDEEMSDEEKFNFIMTYKDESRRRPLRHIIELKNPQPGECSLMKKRRFPAALRFQKVKEGNNPENYMLNELMLYRPQRNEIEIDKVLELYEEKYNGERKIDLVKNQVMEYLESIEEARYFVDLAKDKLDLEETSIKLDPQKEQDNADCSEEEVDEEEAQQEDMLYGHLNPENVDIKDDSSKHGFHKRIEIPDDSVLKESTRNLDEYQREVLNTAVKFAKDLVKARKFPNKPPNSPLLMVHGGAGAGKSTVIKTVSHWVQKILKQSGDSADHPYVVRTAFCGTAAASIDGQTLHSAFGFSFNNKFYSLSDKSRDQRRTILKNLKLVIIDEISMVKSDLLYQIDLRLQEISEKIGIPFGGIGLMVFGDMMQLKPCMGRYIFQNPLNEDFLTTHRIDSRWSMFSSILLEKNHRQGKDKQYADLLNRVRIEDHTEEDLELLETRVRQKGHKDLKEVDIYITGKRKECAKANLLYIVRLPGPMIKLRAIHDHPLRKNYKGRVDTRDGTVGDTGFMDQLILKQNANVMIIYNINTLDSLTNGQIGVLVDATKLQDGQVNMLIIRLNNPNAGQENRKQNPELARKYPDCVFIERMKHTYNLRRHDGNVGSTVSIIQFPVRLAHGVTAHKIQGQTIEAPRKVALDLQSVFDPAQAYVMLSRVQSMDQIYIVGKLDSKKLYMNEAAKSELQRLHNISLNSNPTPWGRNDKILKVASLNIAGLNAHFEDLLNDHKLLKADILQLQETSLDENSDTSKFSIPEFMESSFTNHGKGKGGAVYSKLMTKSYEWNSDNTKQVMKTKYEKIEVINVYRSSTGQKKDLIEKLKQIINPKKLTIITGDFNLCAREEKTNKVSVFLEEMGFSQLVDKATHIQGRIIDHIYINSIQVVLDFERYSPYYSDHDALLVSLNIQVILKYPIKLVNIYFRSQLMMRRLLAMLSQRKRLKVLKGTVQHDNNSLSVILFRI